MTRATRGMRRLVVVLLLLAAIPARAGAQTATAPAMTSAFLLNFAKFTEWPADALPAGQPLAICVTEPAIAEALTLATSGAGVSARPVTVVLTPAARLQTDALRGCGVVYASNLDSRRIGELIDALHGLSVLSVGDSGEFTRRGGVMHLFLQDGNMRFAVNVRAAQAARLQLSSRLLSLARIVTP